MPRNSVNKFGNNPPGPLCEFAENDSLLFPGQNIRGSPHHTNTKHPSRYQLSGFILDILKLFVVNS